MKVKKNKDDEKKKKKKQEDWLSSYIFDVLEKSTEKALEEAINNLFKDWK